MEATTVKLHRSTKSALDQMRQEDESYDEIIQKLVLEMKGKHLKKELIEAYQKKGKQDLQLLEEWEAASLEVE